MKITQNETGQQYQLSTNTELEIERTNPFFNEYGEQSLPVDIPDTDINRKLTGYPHLIVNKAKASLPIVAKIEDGDYMMQCRQAILGAQKKKSISTSFYINEGAFYCAMPNMQLSDIFADEIIPGITTIDQAIIFCTNLLTSEDERFGIFPILIDAEDGSKKYINRLAWMDSNGNVLSERALISEHSNAPSFYNSFERKEIISNATITIPPGFYISPFIRANYLLKRIFQYFGYTLQDNFFTQTEPFTKIVFLNNTVDTLANGIIKLSDLVPHCTCSTILNIFRKKFDCEFIPDEGMKTVKLVLFKDMLSQKATIDLSDRLTSEPIIKYPESYKQVRISSEEKVSDSSNAVDDFESIPDLFKAFPAAMLNKADMSFYRKGFSLGVSSIDKVGSSTIPYQDTVRLDVEDISVPDSQPIMIPSMDVGRTHSAGNRTGYDYVPMLYIGAGNYKNSTIKYDTSTDDISESSTSTVNEDQKPMLAFFYDATGYGYLHGTISSYNYSGSRLWNYSLCYFGEDGLYERFYRSRDNLLRNSLHTISADLLLTNQQKRTIPAHEKIILQGQELFLNILKYKIGGDDDPLETEFLTTRIYEPVDFAQAEADRIITSIYQWQVMSSYSVITEAEYNASEYKDKTYTVFYPPIPTGLRGACYTQYTAKAVLINGNRDTEYRLYTYYLVAVSNS